MASGDRYRQTEKPHERETAEFIRSQGRDAKFLTHQPPGSGDYRVDGQRAEFKRIQGNPPGTATWKTAARGHERAADQKAKGIKAGHPTFDRLVLDSHKSGLSQSDMDKALNHRIREIAAGKAPWRPNNFDVEMLVTGPKGRRTGSTRSARDIHKEVLDARGKLRENRAPQAPRKMPARVKPPSEVAPSGKPGGQQATRSSKPPAQLVPPRQLQAPAKPRPAPVKPASPPQVVKAPPKPIAPPAAPRPMPGPRK